MKRIFITSIITALIVASFFAVANSGILTKQTKAAESVTTIEPTDANLQALDTRIGAHLDRIVPRAYKLSDKEIVVIKVHRSRFTQVGTTRSELRFYDLVGVPIEQRVTEKHRPYITVITTHGSIIRNARAMNVADVRAVVIMSDKICKIVELI